MGLVFDEFLGLVVPNKTIVPTILLFMPVLYRSSTLNKVRHKMFINLGKQALLLEMSSDKAYSTSFI